MDIALGPAVVTSYVPAPTVTVRLRIVREGEVTPGRKQVDVYRDWDSLAKLEMVFYVEAGSIDGYSNSVRLDLATLLAQGEWLFCGVDRTAPKKTKAQYIQLLATGDVLFNISSGEGGPVGDSAVLSARVRVEQQPAQREVVVIERPLNGQWRVAGYGQSVDGELDVDLTVIGGLCYAVAVDDWGVLYSPTLAVTVGQTIRPTLFAGWLYRVTEAGTLPATEPEWWPADGDNAARLIGTARAIAVRYYAPIGHGPVPVEVI